LGEDAGRFFRDDCLGEALDMNGLPTRKSLVRSGADPIAGSYKNDANEFSNIGPKIQKSMGATAFIII
jgi:hypothetical protein